MVAKTDGAPGLEEYDLCCTCCCYESPQCAAEARRVQGQLSLWVRHTVGMSRSCLHATLDQKDHGQTLKNELCAHL